MDEKQEEQKPPAPQTPPAPPDTSPGTPPPATPPKDEDKDGKNKKTFTQDEVNTLIGERLNRDRETLRNQIKAEIDEEARQKQLTDQKQFETLANERQTKITTLEGEKTRLEADLATSGEEVKSLKAIVDTYLKKEREGVSEPIIAILDKLSPVEQLEWLSANKVQVSQTGPKRGVPPSPKSETPPAKSPEEMLRDKGDGRSLFKPSL